MLAAPNDPSVQLRSAASSRLALPQACQTLTERMNIVPVHGAETS